MTDNVPALSMEENGNKARGVKGRITNNDADNPSSNGSTASLSAQNDVSKIVNDDIQPTTSTQPDHQSHSSFTSPTDTTSDAGSNTNNHSKMDPESIYDFYKEHIFPAIMSSFPILVRRIWNDAISWIALAAHQLYLFILPTWWKEQDQRQQLSRGDGENDGGNMVEKYQQWLLNTQKQLWDQAVASSNRVNATVAEFMLQYFDTNNDGHISANELLNMTELFEKLPQTTTVISRAPESFWMWFSREWPLMDWKVGVFLWQTFGGLLLVIAVLSIVPGRLHSWSGKILRWPILGLTYLLIGVELIVYIVIRVVIRVAETIFATPKHRALRRKMAAAESYEEWYQYAAALDLSQKRDKWQRSISDSTSYQYNWPLIQQLMADMKEARQKQDVILAMAVLQQCTRKNVGGIMSEDLFTKTYTGEPKFIVIEFIGEVTKTMHWVTDQVMSADPNDDVRLESDHDSEDLKTYEKSFQHKSRNEREHLWQSLIGLAINVATLNFHPGDDDAKKTGKENKNKEGSSKELNSSPKAAATKQLERLEPTTLIGSPTRSTAHLSSMDDVNLRYTSSGDLISATTLGTEAESEGAPSHRSTGAVPSMAHREQLLVFLKRARAAYGRTALCLSGGAMMGLYHFGHLQGLMETDCLPNIVSGCSAGSVIGAVLCTRTNDELQHDLDPQVIGPHMKCFSRSWSDRIVSLWKTGNLFSEKDWQEMIQWFTCGNMTFEEAYHKTGRIFCIALAATTKKTPPVLLNYISAPNVTIASAVIASAAVPGFVAPQQLEIKDADGTVRSAGPETYFDGSIRHDIPTAGLSEMLNCQFFVACQCNPHIVPFFFDPKGGVGRPSRWSSGDRGTSWRGGFLLAALEMYLKNDMKAKHVFLRDLDAAVSFTGTMLTQSFEGSTTIVPRVRFRDFFTLFSDPSVDSLYHYNQVGAVAAYQHAAMIRLHYRLADALDECIEKLEKGRKEDENLNSSFQVKVSRRASFDMSKKIARAMAQMEVPGENQNMPDVIAAALQERLESDSTSLSDGSTN
ncbi:patatin-like phospholipase [Nitzschia inconspicua]|uniref:Patatin-like phospholipase n=1 Tax=Nitzschia inconspicua TaxID=303405 RepID=A0A9K3PJE1_9STRA|nr:patatin-like phospholipase [Nitzschia inconspicua]